MLSHQINLHSSPSFFSPDEMDMDFYSELDPTMSSPQGMDSGSFPRYLGYLYSKEFQSREDKWIKRRNESEPLHPILVLYDKNV